LSSSRQPLGDQRKTLESSRSSQWWRSWSNSIHWYNANSRLWIESSLSRLMP
jgi:hypothetical protein